MDSRAFLGLRPSHNPYRWSLEVGPGLVTRGGFLFGGSTGTVVSGAMDWLSRHDADGLTAVAIAPDLGERYLDTIYQANWVAGIYGDDVVHPDELASATQVG